MIRRCGRSSTATASAGRTSGLTQWTTSNKGSNASGPPAGGRELVSGDLWRSLLIWAIRRRLLRLAELLFDLSGIPTGSFEQVVEARQFGFKQDWIAVTIF